MAVNLIRSPSQTPVSNLRASTEQPSKCSGLLLKNITGIEYKVTQINKAIAKNDDKIKTYSSLLKNLHSVSLQYGKNSVVRLKNGYFKSGQGSNIFKNIFNAKRYQTERKDAVNYINSGDKAVSAATAMKILEKNIVSALNQKIELSAEAAEYKEIIATFDQKNMANDRQQLAIFNQSNSEGTAVNRDAVNQIEGKVTVGQPNTAEDTASAAHAKNTPPITMNDAPMQLPNGKVAANKNKNEISTTDDEKKGHDRQKLAILNQSNSKGTSVNWGTANKIEGKVAIQKTNVEKIKAGDGQNLAIFIQNRSKGTAVNRGGASMIEGKVAVQKTNDEEIKAGDGQKLGIFIQNRSKVTAVNRGGASMIAGKVAVQKTNDDGKKVRDRQIFAMIYQTNAGCEALNKQARYLFANVGSAPKFNGSEVTQEYCRVHGSEIFSGGNKQHKMMIKEQCNDLSDLVKTGAKAYYTPRDKNIITYRGQGMRQRGISALISQFESDQKNNTTTSYRLGQFFSTSRNINIAKDYEERSQDEVRVLFRVKGNSSNGLSIRDGLSFDNYESERLYSPLANFKVTEIIKKSSKSYIVSMVEVRKIQRARILPY